MNPSRFSFFFFCVYFSDSDYNSPSLSELIYYNTSCLLYRILNYSVLWNHIFSTLCLGSFHLRSFISGPVFVSKLLLISSYFYSAINHSCSIGQDIMGQLWIGRGVGWNDGDIFKGTLTAFTWGMEKTMIGSC